MNGFMISPTGIVVIAVYSFVILMIVLFLSRLMPRFRWKWVVLAPPALVLLSLPWAEEAWISWHFKEACKDAGVKVYRQVEVEGFYEGTIGTGYSFIEQYNFRFMEEKRPDGKIEHTERPEGQWKTTILDRPSARYHVRYAYQPTPYDYEEPIGWKLRKTERQVIDSQTGEILGRQTTVKRVLPTYEALLAGLFGPPIVLCPSPDVQPYVPPPPFLQAVLKPVLK